MAKCVRPACDGVLPATYGFEIDSFESEPTVVVKYCARCVALCITQDFFSEGEVHSLHKLSRREMV